MKKGKMTPAKITAIAALAAAILTPVGVIVVGLYGHTADAPKAPVVVAPTPKPVTPPDDLPKTPTGGDTGVPKVKRPEQTEKPQVPSPDPDPPPDPAPKSDFFDSVTKAATDLYGPRFDRTAKLRSQFEAVFTKEEQQELAANHDYFKNYCRFCFAAMPLHADRFNRWLKESSEEERESVFTGMKLAVMSDDFRKQANVQMDKIDSALEFSMFGDIVSNSSIADDLLKRIPQKP